MSTPMSESGPIMGTTSSAGLEFAVKPNETNGSDEHIAGEPLPDSECDN